MLPFKIQIKTNLIFGPGKIEELPELLKKEKFTKVAAVIDKGVANNVDLQNVFAKIKAEGITFDAFVNEVAEPDYDFLDEFKKNFAGIEYECLIGVGGGSSLDLAKGIAVLLANPGKAIAYRGFPDLKNKPLPVIAIPTTAGTGSEVTYNAVFTDSAEKRKLGINSRLNYPIYAILDPNLTLSCPPSVTVSSGMDAIVHVVESFVSKTSNPLSRMVGKESFQLMYLNLLKVLNDPQNVEVRGKLLLGSYLAGISLETGGGPSSSLSYPLGSLFKVPHGIAGGIFIDKIVKFNVEKGFTGYTELYDSICPGQEISDQEKNKLFIRKMEELSSALNVPKKLTHFKISKEHKPAILEFTSKYMMGGINQNPLKMELEDVDTILESMF
ncbi:MAG: iron-containing alcohol dehydrogenase [Nanoarchaeota archaeon]